MKRKIKWISLVCWTGLTIVLGACAVFLLLLRFNVIHSYHAYVVQSGSMSPSIQTGSVVFVQKLPLYQPGDVVTFAQNGNKNVLVTHRVELAYRSEEYWKELTYVTKGDANNDFDEGRVRDSEVVGKVLFSVPFLGYGVNVAKTPKGFIALVIIPATIIVYEEVKNLWVEVTASAMRMKSWMRKKHPAGLEEIGTSGTPKPLWNVRKMALVPIFGVASVVIAFTSSFFYDRETSTGNLITILAPSPTPTPVLPP